MRIQDRMKVELSQEAMNKEMQRSVDKELQMTREHEKQRKSDQEKIQQLEMLLDRCRHQIEGFQKASEEHEASKEELEKSVAEKDEKLSEMEARLCLQRGEHDNLREKVREVQMSLESSREKCEVLKIFHLADHD